MTKSPIGAKEVLLKGVDIFSSLLEHEIALIAENSKLRNYNANEPVFSRGDTGDSLYIVDSGEVLVQKQDENGRKINIARFVQGDYFGEVGFFTESLRIASSFTSVASKLLVFPGDNTGFTAFLNKNPALSAQMLHKIMVNVAMRIRKVNILVKENSPLVQELKKQVYRDKLTGLYNQTYLLENIREQISAENSNFYLFISKPDNFKDLNDTYGHDAGDTAIQIMARDLRNFIGDDSRIARYQGNAMAILVSGVTRMEAVVFARRIREFLNNLDVSSACRGNSFKITASIGISCYPGYGTNAEELLFKTHELPLIGRNNGGNKILFPEDAGESE
ncbi:MAG: GGDEF domain-containing protein [Spirochaetales bacterium]|nr:GGDEF domain-containing protein [Spirochaetales bacterium]